MRSDDKSLLIPKIENGHVIDHIPAGLGTAILHLLEMFPSMHDVLITLGRNLSSKRLGRKDLLKISSDELPGRFLEHLSLIASGVTIKQIRAFKVVRKIVVDPPEIISGMLECLNPNCITNHERHLGTCFNCCSRDPLTYACNYCERHFALAELHPAAISVALPAAISRG